MKKIIASGPVIIKEGKLFVTKDKKDSFYKIPGGTLEEGESLEECVLRELMEETGFSCKIIKKLSTMYLDKRPGSEEEVKIELHHYLAELNFVENYEPYLHFDHVVEWLDIEGIKQGKYNVVPNIKFLIDKGEI
jgi:8-oxo-dGTP pyrophosphatase MutT (NUDIX family)